MRRRMALVTAAVLALSVGSPTRAPAAQMTAVMDGFTASRAGSLETNCNGAGPTSMALLGDTAYLAADGSLYVSKAGTAPRKQLGNVQPWGLAATGGKLYATQPHCNAAVTTDPLEGSNCDVVEVNPGTTREVRQVSTACGFALTAHPFDGSLTVAGRDGNVVSVSTAGGGQPQPLFDLGDNNWAKSLAWAADGSRLFLVRQDGTPMVWRGSGAPQPLPGAGGSLNSVAIGNSVGMPGSVLTGGGAGTPVKALAVDPGAPAGNIANSSAPAVIVLAASAGIYVAQASELYLLRGQYRPPAPPPPPPRPTTPPTTSAPRVTPTSVVRAVAPAIPAQAPPPPPPPAPPAPPLATAAQVVAQPSAVANPAIVPGEQEREAAMRLAATGLPRRLAPYVLWIALAMAVCGGGLGAGMARRRSDAGRYAWADTD